MKEWRRFAAVFSVFGNYCVMKRQKSHVTIGSVGRNNTKTNMGDDSVAMKKMGKAIAVTLAAAYLSTSFVAPKLHAAPKIETKTVFKAYQVQLDVFQVIAQKYGIDLQQLKSLEELLQPILNWPNVTKPTAPPATPKPTTPPATQKPTTPPATQKPTTPPATQKPTTPPATQKPTTPPATTNPTTPPATTAPGYSAVQQQILQLVNQERAKAGLNALALDSLLTKVATEKARDMSANNYFSHTSPTYGSPFDMMRSFGVKYSYAGENIAAGQRSAQEVMNAWMNSSGHRANILNANFTKIGVGYVNNQWVQMFIG